MNGALRKWLAMAGVALVLAGCQDDTGPGRRNILGSWRSDGIPGVAAQMTLAEIARAVEGAGSWTESTSPYAFRVSGVLTTDQFSLLFEFSDRPDVAFEGRFLTNDVIGGVLTGGEFSETAATFSRVRDWP